MVVWAPKFESYSDDVPIHLPREEPSYLTKFTLDLVSLSVKEEKVIAIPEANSFIYVLMVELFLQSLSLDDNLPPLQFLSVGVVERPSTSPRVSPRIVYLR